MYYILFKVIRAVGLSPRDFKSIIDDIKYNLGYAFVYKVPVLTLNAGMF